jgi:hypothetical protein
VVLNGSVDKRGDMVSKFFKQVSRHFANDMAVVSPNAELLGHQPADGLKKWKAMPAEQRKLMVDFGDYNESLDPAPPAGGLRFNVFARAFTRTGAALEIYKTKVTRSLEAGRDHLWLNAAEAAALASLKVPDSVVDRIVRTCLVDLVRVGGNGNARKAEDVLSREMTLTAIEPGRLKISGSARVQARDVGSGATPGEPKKDEYRFSGEAGYDAVRKVFTRFDFVAFSETGHYDEVAQKVLPFGVAFELSAAETPSDLLPPAFYSTAYFKER